MKLICPGCGAIASAESWMNDDLCRETLACISKLPTPLPKAVLGYLSLFRPGKQSLTWKKALRLSKEIEQLVATGFVKVQGKVDRNCPPSFWARAMEQMVEQRSGLRLPMASHIYLQKIAWDLAEQADYGAEKKAVATSQNTRVRQSRMIDPILDPLEKARQEYDKKLESGEVEVDLTNLSSIVKGIE